MLTWSCCAWGQCQVGWDTNPMGEDGGGRGRKEEWIPAGAVADAGLVSLLLSGLLCSIRNGCTALRVEGGGGGEERMVHDNAAWELLCSALSAGTERWWQSCI